MQQVVFASGIWGLLLAPVVIVLVRWLRRRSRDPIAEAQDALYLSDADNDLARRVLEEAAGKPPTPSGVRAMIEKSRVSSGGGGEGPVA